MEVVHLMATRTARQVITDAFHRIGFISEDEGLSAEQVARALYVMNDMMNGFNAEGIPYVHTDLTLDTTVNVPDELVRSVMWMLADEIAGEYGKTLTPRQQQWVAEARSNLQAYYYQVPPAQLDAGIEGRGLPGTWDISRG
jgi:hypothetical protein